MDTSLKKIPKKKKKKKKIKILHSLYHPKKKKTNPPPKKNFPPQKHASFICSGNTMPIVLVDWSDIREQKRLMVLRASVALHGRSVTLYEKAFPLSEQCSKKAHDQFLADLASILPSNTTPLIVSDAGFKVPWYKSVEKLGWYWLSRVRGKVQYADLGAENWKPISNLHDMSSSHSKTLGYKRLTKSNPISCQILLYKSRSKGRKNQRSTRTHCHHPSLKLFKFLLIQTNLLYYKRTSLLPLPFSLIFSGSLKKSPNLSTQSGIQGKITKACSPQGLTREMT